MSSQGSVSNTAFLAALRNWKCIALHSSMNNSESTITRADKASDYLPTSMPVCNGVYSCDGHDYNCNSKKT
eukprot:5988441-Amphidinium_carterae.1